MDDDFISASEISDYLYCQRAWWYRQHGIESTQLAVMEQGTAQHEELAQEMQQIEQKSRLAWRLFLFGVGLLIAILILKLMTGY